MNELVPNRVALFADTVSDPRVVEAARLLVDEGYELMVVGAGAPAAVQTLTFSGIPARPVLGAPADVLGKLGSAVVLSGPGDAQLGDSAPNRVVLGQSPDDYSVESVDCFRSWVESYLAPRVPRLQFNKVRP